jgi:hypothetical protein
MTEVLHKSRRTPRPWTAQEQLTLEVAAACGVSLSKLARYLDRSIGTFNHHLIPAAAAKNREGEREWRKQNLEKDRERHRRWWRANREKSIEYNRLHQARNPDKFKVWARARAKEWRRRNPEKVKAIQRRWRDSNIDHYRSTSAARTRRRNALKRASRRKALLPANRQIIESRFELWGNCCAYCGVDGSHPRNSPRKRLAEEHVIPLSMLGLDEPGNIVPACLQCNSSKHDKPVEAWYISQPFFTEARWRKIKRHCPAASTGQVSLALPT